MTIKKKLNTLVKKINSASNTQPFILGKILAMSYLTVAIEPIFQKKNNKNIEIEILKVINNSISIFQKFLTISKFRSKQNVNQTLLNNHNNFISMHKKLWQEIWPEHSFNDYDKLVEYRGKRLDYNKIKKEFLQKDVLDFGCGNGSIAIAVMKRGARSVLGIDFGKKNILAAKKWSKKYKFNNKMKFICADILKFKPKKKYDFIICSAVLHHLKNHSQLIRAMKNIKSACKNGTYLYFYVRGYGGARSLIQESCVKCFKNIDAKIIREHLHILNFSREKITHLVDWFKAIYLQTKPEKLHKLFKNLGFKNYTRLKGPHKNDLDINQIKDDKNSYLKFGTGELRYICEYKK